MAKKRDIAPVAEINVKPDQPSEDELLIGDDAQTFSLTPDVAMAINNILTLAFTSTRFPPQYVVNAVEEIQSIILTPNPNDPTGTSLTVHPAWVARFQADAAALTETFEKIAQERMAAAQQAEEISDEAVEEAASTEPAERN